MKSIRTVLVFAFACAAGSTLLAAQAAPAPSAGSMTASSAPTVNASCTGAANRVAYLNVQQAIESVDEGKKAAADLATRFDPISAQLNKADADIKAKMAQVSSGSATLSDAAKAQLNQEIQTMQRNAQQTSDNAKSDYQQAQNDLINQIGGKLMNVLEQFSEDHCVDSILDDGLQWPNTPLLYAKKDLDITGTVIDLYNKRYPVTGGMPSNLSAPKPGTSAPAKPTVPGAAAKPGGGGGH